MMNLSRGKKIAAHLVDQLRPYCSRIEIAGSIRRGCPEVGDVDLVMRVTDMPGLRKRILTRCTLQKDGEQYMEALMPDGTQLDLWFAHSPAPPKQDDFFSRSAAQPDNFGSLLLSRTGSKLHNITLCQRALAVGLRWNPHWGVYQAGVCLASATEEEIYSALGVPFIPPERRELATKDGQLRLIHYKGGA